MLLDLPPELLISVLKYLPLPDISSCIQTSRALKLFIDQHESVVYRQAAAHPSLRLVPHDQLLFSELIPLGLLSKRYIGDASDWKSLCRRAREVRSCWVGEGPSRIKDYHHGYTDYANVHRIKVDEKRGFIITTHGQRAVETRGRVLVSEINDGQLIWSLDSRHVRQNAHCEYGEGFLIFDRSMDMKEVWRLVSQNPESPDPEDFQVVPQSKPDESQLSTVYIAPPGSRLKFVPHALLQTPGGVPTKAFRFVYPTLLVASSNCLFFWDVRTGELVEHIDDIGSQVPPDGFTSTQTWANIGPSGLSLLGRILYVEVNDKYALVCGESAFKMFRRRTSQTHKSISKDPRAGSCVMGFKPDQLQKRGRWEMGLGYIQPKNLPPNFEDHRRASHHLLHPRIDFWKSSGKAVVSHKITPKQLGLARHLRSCSMAAHISPCGQHLAILNNGSRLLVIPYFERVIDGRVQYHDIMIDLQIASPLGSIYLAYEDDRIAVVTQMGLFIVHPTLPPPDDFETPPTLDVQRVALLNDSDVLSHVSCLQMTSTGIWINWEVSPDRPGLFSSALAKLEEDEESFEEKIYNAAIAWPISRWVENSVVVSVDFGLGSE